MNNNMLKKMNTICLIGYLVLLINIMYISTNIANVGDIKYIDKIIYNSNFIPFKEMDNSKHLFTSIIIYIPLAILLPNSFTKMKNRKYFYLSIFLIIFSIEILQVLTLHGYADINDLLFGFFGTIIVYEMMGRIKKKI